jgi:hypothetical protein
VAESIVELESQTGARRSTAGAYCGAGARVLWRQRPLQTAEQAETNLGPGGGAQPRDHARAGAAGVFDAVVARFADPGALMQAATTSQASSLPVLQIADNGKLRIGAMSSSATSRPCMSATGRDRGRSTPNDAARRRSTAR